MRCCRNISKLAAGLIRQSAAMAADSVERRKAPYEMPPEASRHLGAALRRVAAATGLTKTGGRSRLLGALRDMCVPEDVVAAVEDAYNETDFAAETRRFEAERRERMREEEVDDEAGRADDSYQEERNIAGLVDNDDLGSLSQIVRWFFPAEGGNVSATLLRIRESLINLGMLAEANVARAVRTMPDAERVSANVRRFVEALSVGDDRADFDGRNASSAFWSTDQKEVSQILDDVVRALTAMGKTEYAISVAAIRNIPSRDGRRTKVLQMAAQMNGCDPVFVSREGGDLSVRPMDRLVDSNRASNVMQGLYGSLLRVRAAVRKGGWTVNLTGDRADSLAEGIVGMLEMLSPKPKMSMAATLTAGWETIDPALRANWVDIDAAPRYRPGATEYAVAVDAADLEAVLGALRSGTSADAAEALDRIQALIWRRMQGMAQAVDLILGTGSTPAAMLRSRDTLAYIRAAADRALDTVVNRRGIERRLGRETGKKGKELEALVGAEVRRLDAVRRTGVEQLLQMANYFATSKRTNRHAGTWSTQHCSAFLSDLLQEPFAQLAMRLGAPEARVADGFIQPSDADGLRDTVRDGIAKAVGDGRLGKTPRAVVRAMLLDIGAMKAATGLNVSRALTPERMTQVKAGNTSYDPSRAFATPALRVLVNGYLSSLPAGSRSLGGYSRDRKEAQENRAVTTLPSDIPAELRAYNHPLFNGVKVDGRTLREMLEENGGRWPDGSRPLVAVVGAKDYDGSLLPKEYLAGALDSAIREEYASGRPTHVLIPFFRADKPSCFALRIPRRIAEEWVRQVAADEGLMKSLRPQVADAVREAADAMNGLVPTTGAAGAAQAKPAEAKIDSFHDKGGRPMFLSNMFDAPVEVDGVIYRNAEAAFQAQKEKDPEARKRFAGMSGKEAKAAGRAVKLTAEEVNGWNSRRIETMRRVLQAKFEQNPSLKDKLLATGNSVLEEGNTWGDRFWGTVSGKGENNLGKLLMQIRTEAMKAGRADDPVSAATLATYVNHSGGADGSDTAWGRTGARYGVRSNHYYYRSRTPNGNVDIAAMPGAYEEGLEKYRAAAKAMGRNVSSDPYVLGLMSRNWQQVRNSDAVFAIGRGFDENGNVLGGTGYAVQMAKAEGKTVYVFDQPTRRWLVSERGGAFGAFEGTPKLAKNFAGIGTRELRAAGRAAIEDAYRVTQGLPARGRDASADTYDAIAGLMLTAAGQADIDPKRVATTLAIAPIVPMYRPLPEGAQGEEPACHFVSVIGGVTGASLTGAYQITGCGAENVRTMSEGNPESQKLHITSHALGVTFKKGQGNDYGLGFDEAGDVSTLASVRYYQAQARRYLEGLLGLDDGSLDPVSRPQDADADAVEAWKRDVLAPHNEAVKVAREFLKTSTVVIDDLETNKAGIFGSSFGFAWDGKSPFTLSLMDGTSIAYDPKSRTVTDGDGKALSGGWNVVPDAKNGQMPLLWGVSALCMAKGGSLTAGDIEGITARWRLTNGTVTEPMTLRETGVLADGDRFTVRDDGNGNAVVAFRTRNIAAQIVANNANGSAPEYGHTFAANATRDMELLDTLNHATGSVDEKGSRRFVTAHTAYSALVLGSLRQNPELVSLACGRDQDLAEAYRAHPFDPEVRDVVAKKVMAFVRREGFIGFYGTHGVMCPSAGNGHTPIAESRGGHTVRIEWLPGTTQYDKDTFRPARIFNTREAAFYGQSRDLGSGCVNVRSDGFRYGLYLDEEAFAKLELPDGAGGVDDAIDAAEWAAVEGCDAAEAETAKRLVRAIRIAALDSGFRTRLLACFTDYTGRRAADSAGSRNARFDDLFRDGDVTQGRFDLTALNIGRSRRNSVDDRGSATGRIYLCGSPFIAHRSPSGNVESFQGIVRATAPVTFNAKTGLPGREAKYALDPITMLLQGSDTDGDSAGLQYLDYSATYRLRQEDLEAVALSADPLKEAERLQWTERVPVQTADGERTVTVVRDDVLRAVMREAFLAQLEAHRRAATFHQGQQDAERMPPKSRTYAADDVWSGAEFADHYAAERPEYLMTRELDNEFLCDYAWAGRQPVGTDAVWDEQVDPERLDGLSAKARAILEKVDGAERMTYDRLLKAYVDAAGYGEKTNDLVSPGKSAMLSDAASDSAKARGISVFNQARMFRALARNILDGVRVDLVAPDGYAPLVDFISHIDGVSNNLFHMLKLMFSNRAGWNVQMLPYLFGYILQYAPKAKRLNNAFFFTVFANFLANLKDPASPLARLASFLDPMKGRENIVRAIEELGYGGKEISLYNSVEENAFRCCRKAGVKVKDNYGKLTTPRGRDAVLCVAAWRPDRKTPTQAEKFIRAMRTATADVASVNAPIDYMTLAGKGWEDITKRGREALDLMAKGPAADGPVNGLTDLRMQYNVTRILGDVVGAFAETPETVEESARTAERSEREAAKMEGWRPERWGGKDPAKGPDFASNVQRFAHLVPMAAKAKGFVDAFGGTAYGFVAGFSEAIRRLSAEAWRRYDGRTDKPIGRLLRALESRNGRIGLRSRMSEADIERLREGFAALSTYAGELTLSYGAYGQTARTMRVSGKDLADMLVMFAGMTQPYGASTSYYGQSNLPAVFGDAAVASLERGARLVYADRSGGLDSGSYAFLKAARVKPVRTPAGVAYDVMAPEFQALAKYVQAARPDAAVREPIAAYARLADSLNAVRVRVTSLRGLGGESVGGERLADGPVPAPEFGKRMDVRTVFRDGDGTPVKAFRPGPASTELFASPEEAYNRMLANEEARLTTEGAEEELAYYRRYLAENGRAVSDAGGRAARSLTRLIADAAAHSPEVYGVIAEARGRFILHRNPAMQEALNAVADRVMSGSLAEPTVRSACG